MAAVAVHPITWLLTVALTLLHVTWLEAVTLLLVIALLVAITLLQTVEIGLPKPQEVLAVAEDAGSRWTVGREGPAWGGLIMQPDGKVLLPASVQQKLEPGVQFLSPGHASLVFRLEDALLFVLVGGRLFLLVLQEREDARVVHVRLVR